MKQIFTSLVVKLLNADKSVTRISLEVELKRQFKKLKPGIVLDIGTGKGAPYKKYIANKKYLTLDIDKNSSPDICADIHNFKWEANYFHTVIAIELLEHLYDPQKAIDQIHRILKTNGICILSTRFLYPYHKAPEDYYRFTQDSLNYLFKEFKKVNIYHHGNKLQVLWQAISDCGPAGLPFRLF